MSFFLERLVLFESLLLLLHFLVKYPCWTHLFERAKIMLWFVRLALYASINFFELRNCSSASLISFWAWCALIFLKKYSHASLRLIWELVNFLSNSLMLHIYYFERWIFLCSCSPLKFVWAYQKAIATYEISPKVTDIQEGYNKNFHKDHWTE